MSSRHRSNDDLGRDTDATVTHAQSVIAKAEARRAHRAAAGRDLDGLRVEARRYVNLVLRGLQPSPRAVEEVEAAYIAGATRVLGPQNIGAEARILVEEFYGPCEPSSWQLENAQRAIERLREHRGGAL